MFLQKTHNIVCLLSHSFYLAEWCPDYSGPRSGIFVGYGGGLCGLYSDLCPIYATWYYGCINGYVMNGSAFTTCRENKEWYPTVGKCVYDPQSE